MKLEGMNIGRAIVQLGIDEQSEVTISSTPFGTSRGEPNQAYLKGAVPWKGDTGKYEGGELKGLDSAPKKVKKGLESAIKMAKDKASDVKGTTYKNGVYMPKAAATLAEEAE